MTAHKALALRVVLLSFDGGSHPATARCTVLGEGQMVAAQQVQYIAIYLDIPSSAEVCATCYYRGIHWSFLL